MKQVVITILLFGSFACSNPADQSSPDQAKSAFAADSSGKNKGAGTCNFDRFINDPRTPKLARDIYLDRKWNLDKDNEALALLDSLTATDKTSRPFYFKVVTESYRKADGYYSEGLGLAAYTFVEQHTQEFVAYFDDTACHTRADLSIWADMLVSELAISREGAYDQPVIEDLMKQLQSSCKDCTPGQKETLNRFGLHLKEKWREFSKPGTKG